MQGRTKMLSLACDIGIATHAPGLIRRCGVGVRIEVFSSMTEVFHATRKRTDGGSDGYDAFAHGYGAPGEQPERADAAVRGPGGERWFRCGADHEQPQQRAQDLYGERE